MYSEVALEFLKIAHLKCTTNEKRNISEHDKKNFKWVSGYFSARKDGISYHQMVNIING